jgi:predicted lipoprotein with Yx(FWY)xxD motif
MVPGEGGLQTMQRLIVPLVAAALGLVLAVPALAQPAGEPLVKVATDPALGRILVDNRGMTLYLYSRDENGVSNCYDQCEARWPILRPPASGAPTGAPDINGTLGVIDRRDGTKQVTYNNIPLYFFTPDEKPGDTKGQAVGGIWWILPPGINEITPAQAQAQAAPAAQPSPAAKPGAPPAAAPAAAPAAKPAAQPSPAPAQAPSSLPRTGGAPFDPTPLVVSFGAAGAALTVIGAALVRRRGGRRD